MQSIKVFVWLLVLVVVIVVLFFSLYFQLAVYVLFPLHTMTLEDWELQAWKILDVRGFKIWKTEWRMDSKYSSSSSNSGHMGNLQMSVFAKSSSIYYQPPAWVLWGIGDHR